MSPSVIAFLLATVFLVAHLALLPSTPTGVDAVNFVLGVRDYDVADHRPHPPGYPVFIALGKTSAAVIEGLGASFDVEPRRAETYAVALWSAVFGAIAVFALRRLFSELGAGDGHAIAAAALTVSCPLFWFNGVRAMSDVTGLTAALVAQALTVSAFRRSRIADHSALRLLTMAAFITGLAIGVRSQVAWLALPLLTFAMVDHARRAGFRTMIGGVAAFMAGGLLWTIPLILADGGPSAYLAAIGLQAREDVTSGRMLAANPDVGLALRALIHTLGYPWAHKYLAAAVLGLASIGAVSLLFRQRLAVLLLALSFGPYAIFHLLFQDTTFVRYALPLVPAVSFLAVCSLTGLTRAWYPWIVMTALVVASLCLAIPSTVRHARSGSPSLRALDDIRARLLQTDRQPVLAMHHAVSRVLRLDPLHGVTLPAAPKSEWLELVRYWRDGGQAPVWFLAEPERTDLALIDPRARRLVSSYRPPVDQRFFLSGVRPSGVDWYEFDRPGWFVAEGWALTPETAGVAEAAAHGPAYAAVAAYVRRRDEPAVMAIGGRHLQLDGAPVRFELLVDGRALDTWQVQPAGSFLRVVPLPSGLLHSRFPESPSPSNDGAAPIGADARPDRHFALVQIRSVAADGSGALVRTSIEQFDIQSTDRVVTGMADGWFEQEYDEEAVRLWRWMGPTAEIQIHNGGHDVVLQATGDAPISWLGGATTVVVRAGDDVLGRFVVSDRFDFRLRIPAAALNRSRGRLTFQSDRSFSPHEVIGTADRRVLSLRVFQLKVDADSPAP